jgi:hypothetical protein
MTVRVPDELPALNHEAARILLQILIRLSDAVKREQAPAGEVSSSQEGTRAITDANPNTSPQTDSRPHADR